MTEIDRTPSGGSRGDTRSEARDATSRLSGYGGKAGALPPPLRLAAIPTPAPNGRAARALRAAALYADLAELRFGWGDVRGGRRYLMLSWQLASRDRPCS